jgi:hypothetical protein
MILTTRVFQLTWMTNNFSLYFYKPTDSVKYYKNVTKEMRKAESGRTRH